MNCPSCHRHASSFLEWMKGTRMLVHVCPHCGQSLRASGRTKIVFALTLAAIPFVIYASDQFCDHFGITDHEPRRGIFVLCFVGVTFPISFLEWRTGT